MSYRSRQNRTDDAPQVGTNKGDSGLAYPLPFALVVLLHLAGWYFPTYYTWGFNYWHWTGDIAAVVGLTTALILLVPSLSSLIADTVTFVIAWFGRVFFLFGAISKKVVFAVLLFCILFLLRSEAHVYGDGYTVLSSLMSSDEPWIFDQLYLQPAAVLLHRGVISLTQPWLGFDVETVFALVNCLGGLLGLWAVYRLASALAGSVSHRWCLVFGTLTSGTVILFFGYIEYYTWATAIGLWSLYYSVKHVQGRSRLWPALLLAVLAVTFHVVALPYLVVVILSWLAAGKSDSVKQLSGTNLVLAAMILFCVTVGIAAVVQYTKLENVLVLLSPISINPYWLLSWAHIIDVVNQALLVAPLGVVAFFFLLFTRDKNPGRRPRESLVLGSAAYFHFLAAFWISPVIGAPRDWDLLSFYGIPFSLWAVWRLSRIGKVSLSRRWVVVAAVVMLVHLLPNLYEKNHLSVAVTRLDAMLWHSDQYRIEHNGANQARVWGILLRDELERPDLAVRHFRRRLQADSTCATCWFGIGDYFQSTNVLDSASYYYRRAATQNSTHKKYLFRLANVETELGNYEVAYQALQQMLSIDPDDSKVHLAAGVITSKTGDFKRALRHYRQSLQLQPNQQLALANMGRIYAHEKVYDSATAYYRRALSLSPEEELYRELLEFQVSMGKNEDAMETLNSLMSRLPNSETARLFRSRSEQE